MVRRFPTAERPLVVVVEDDTALCGALNFSLDLEGYDVRIFGTGEDLLASQLPITHACLVIDERLPGVTGLDALRELRRRGILLPALLITTNPTAVLRRAAAEAEVPIVEKPLLGDTLMREIRSALDA